jgi:hypothetical protein
MGLDNLSDYPFSFKETKAGKVFIYWHDKQAAVLTGAAASKFLEEVRDAGEDDAQLLMARLTGNFKHGNERTAKQKRDN